MYKRQELYYDFVEVMACKRGCIIGGGQPVPIGPRTKKARLEGLYKMCIRDRSVLNKKEEMNHVIA